MINVKAALKSIVPTPLRSSYHRTLRKTERNRRIQRARTAFVRAAQEPKWLEPATLAHLQQQYAFPPDYGYDLSSLQARAAERAQTLTTLLAAAPQPVDTVLELGCWDGMVAAALQAMGKQTTAIDARAEGFRPEAAAQGVTFLEMDAADLKFPDQHFDLTFSYDGFEHFADPATVLQEAMRVTKIGGHLYFKFGPLYMSSRGLHAYRSITVPYCQFLFPEEILADFIAKQQLKPVNFAHVNGWTLKQFRALWKEYATQLDVVQYQEVQDLAHLTLIEQYPSCFRSKTDWFDNLIVADLEVLLRRRG